MNRGDADEHGGSYRVNRGEQVGSVRDVVREGHLVRLQRVPRGLRRVQPLLAHQPLAVHEVAPVDGVVVRHAALLEGHGDELADAHARLARAVEEDALLRQVRARRPQAAEHPREGDARGALDVVVEARLTVPVPLQYPERVGVAEVLELHQTPRLPRAHLGHELLDNLVVLPSAQPLPPQAFVHRVLQQGLVVGAHVDAHGQTLVRPNPRAHAVQQDLALGDAHAARAEVAQAQDPLAVRHDRNLQVVRQRRRCPRPQRLAHATLIVRGDVHALLSDRERVVRLASLAHRGGVHVRHDLHRVVHQQSVEDPRVLVLQLPEEDVLVDGARCSAKAI